MVTKNAPRNMLLNGDDASALDRLVFYAVDKASPYALAQFPTTDSLDKIKKITLLSLGITEQGTSMMWLWINAHCQPMAKPVAADVASKCKTVADVRAAVKLIS
ncbi:MAG: hypothetical protein ABIP34_08340 [Rhodoferax sp.]|uniref:hypothetical protein n=1 Tax=Rhodoferax sp. TaxID=50421 RepID=UPI003266751F